MTTLVSYDIKNNEDREDFREFLKKNNPVCSLESFYEFKGIDWTKLNIKTALATKNRGRAVLFQQNSKTGKLIRVEFKNGKRV